VKAYPVTSAELWGLGGVGLAASVFFSMAAAFITFAIDTTKDLDLSVGVPMETAAYWEAAQCFALWGGILVLVLAFVLLVSGSLYILHILKRTVFDDRT